MSVLCYIGAVANAILCICFFAKGDIGGARFTCEMTVLLMILAKEEQK